MTNPDTRAPNRQVRRDSQPEACTITRCDIPPTWTVATYGHPNGDMAPTWYCREHARQHSVLLWEESPAPYQRVINGPFPNPHPPRLTDPKNA